MITTTHAERKHIARPGTTRADHRFGRYKKEEKREVRQADVKEDTEVMRQLKELWKAYRYQDYRGGEWAADTSTYYNLICRASKKIRYSAKDVERFSIALAEFQDEKYFDIKVGLFLSALINKGKDKDYVIHTSHLFKPPNVLGYLNRKNITVNGDVGDWAGQRMKRGTIIVNGNAGGCVGGDMRGYGMKGGTILIRQNASYSVGNCMRGGKIILEGNAGTFFGSWMNGGEIHIQGNFESLANNVFVGKIYHKGELIVKPTMIALVAKYWRFITEEWLDWLLR